METIMSNATVKFFVKRAAAAAVLVVVAAGATASAGAATGFVAARQSETIFVPKAMPGCWTDNGYGRFTSCDAG
jgi:hypothetical protein